MGTPITLKTMKADTRDAAIDTLAKTWPLNARQVYSEVRDTQHLNITYQGVHKVLNQLVKEKIAVTQDRKYELDASWIKSLRKFAETADKNYSKAEIAPHLEIGTGSSVEKDAFTAGKEAAEKALKQIRVNRELQLTLVFSSNIYEKEYNEVLKGIRAITKDTPLAGCSTVGEIKDRPLKKSVVVAIFAADKEIFSAETISLPVTAEHYAGSGFKECLDYLEKKAPFGRGFPNIGLIFFPGYTKERGMQTIAPKFLEEFNTRCSDPFSIVGCVAGDDWAFNTTAQFCDEKAMDDIITFVTIRTTLKFGIRRAHGFNATSEARYKLKVENDLITKIAKIQNGKIAEFKPAVDVYVKETGIPLGELKECLPLFIRELLAKLDKTLPITRVVDGMHGFPCIISGKSMRFSSPFANGDIVQISNTTPTDIIRATKNAIHEAEASGGVKNPVAVVLFSCASLECMLNSHQVNEIEKIKTGNLSNVPIFGCYNQGEIGPMAVPQGSGTVVALVFGNELRE